MKGAGAVGVGVAAAVAGIKAAAAQPQPAAIPFDEIFNRKAGQYAVPKRLMVAIVAHESAFDPRAENEEAAADAKRGRDVDSLGLGQILWPDTAKDLGITYRAALFDPETNLDGVARVLRRHLARYPETTGGFPADAVSAYNAGHSLRAGQTFGNQKYVNAVRANWEGFVNV